MANIYLQVEFKTGKIFQYSKTEQEGFESHTNTKDTVSYRRYYAKGLYGTLKGISVRKTNFGDEISIHMADKEGNAVYLSIPLFSQNGGIATYAESLIRVVGKLVVGNQYRIYPYAIQEEGDKYAKYGVSVKDADVQAETVVDEKLPLLSYTYTPKGKDTVKGDIPQVVWTEKMGKNVKDSSEKDEYLYAALMAVATDARDGSAPKPKQAAPATNGNKAMEPGEKTIVHKQEPTKAEPASKNTDLPF